MARGPRRPVACRLSPCPPLLPHGGGGGGGGGARDSMSAREIAEKASHMGRRKSPATARGSGTAAGRAGAGGRGQLICPPGPINPEPLRLSAHIGAWGGVQLVACARASGGGGAFQGSLGCWCASRPRGVLVGQSCTQACMLGCVWSYSTSPRVHSAPHCSSVATPSVRAHVGHGGVPCRSHTQDFTGCRLVSFLRAPPRAMCGVKRGAACCHRSMSPIAP